MNTIHLIKTILTCMCFLRHLTDSTHTILTSANRTDFPITEKNDRNLRFVSKRKTKQLPPSISFDEFRKKRFIFVGGSPQSGTSLLRKILVTNHSSGQESCLRHQEARCELTNIEGQWLLDSSTPRDKQLKSIYGVGKLDVFRTEKDLIVSKESSVTTFEDEMRKYLWNSWSRYWNKSKNFLLEKSPPNFLKMRFLSQLFSLYFPAKFLMIIKDPIANGHFESPRTCRDIKTCETNKASIPPLLIEIRDKLSVVNDTVRKTDCIEEEKLCVLSFSAKLLYLKQWIDGHEAALQHLKSWPTSQEQVKFIRYEEITQPCLCEKFVTFAYSDQNMTLLIPKSEIFEACKFEKCDRKLSHMIEGSTNNGRKQPVEWRVENRQLKYEGGGLLQSTAILDRLETTHLRYQRWAKQMELLHSLKPYTSLLLETINSYEAKINRLGYSILYPGKLQFQTSSDIFEPWMI